MRRSIPMVLLFAATAILVPTYTTAGEPQAATKTKTSSGQIPAHLLAQFGLSGSTQISDAAGMQIRGKGKRRTKTKRGGTTKYVTGSRKKNSAKDVRKKTTKRNSGSFNKQGVGRYSVKYR